VVDNNTVKEAKNVNRGVVEKHTVEEAENDKAVVDITPSKRLRMMSGSR
jgi:hypothetical protein